MGAPSAEAEDPPEEVVVVKKAAQTSDAADDADEPELQSPPPPPPLRRHRRRPRIASPPPPPAEEEEEEDDEPEKIDTAKSPTKAAASTEVEDKPEEEVVVKQPAHAAPAVTKADPPPIKPRKPIAVEQPVSTKVTDPRKPAEDGWSDEVVVVRRPGEPEPVAATAPTSAALSRMVESTPAASSSSSSSSYSLMTSWSTPQVSCAMRPSTTGSTLLVGLFAGLVLGVMLERWRRRRANAGASVGTRPARAALATDEESAQPSRPRTLNELKQRSGGGGDEGFAGYDQGGIEHGIVRFQKEDWNALDKMAKSGGKAAAKAAKRLDEAFFAEKLPPPPPSSSSKGSRPPPQTFASTRQLEDKLGELWTEMSSKQIGGKGGAATPATPVTPPVGCSSGSRGSSGGSGSGGGRGPSLKQLAEEKRQQDDQKAIQKTVEVMGRPQEATEDHTMSKREVTERMFAEREEKRRSIEAEEKKAAEEAEAAAAALIAKYRVSKGGAAPSSAPAAMPAAATPEEEDDDDDDDEFQHPLNRHVRKSM